jgi:hypothetical protein
MELGIVSNSPLQQLERFASYLHRNGLVETTVKHHHVNAAKMIHVHSSLVRLEEGLYILDAPSLGTVDVTSLRFLLNDGLFNKGSKLIKLEKC